MSSINFTLSWLAPVFTRIISIGLYQYFNETLIIEDVFTCLGIFRGLQAIPNFYNNLYGMCVSLKRIEAMLFEKEINRKSLIKNDQEIFERHIAIKIENGEYYYKSQFTRKPKRSSTKIQLKPTNNNNNTASIIKSLNAKELQNILKTSIIEMN